MSFKKLSVLALLIMSMVITACSTAPETVTEPADAEAADAEPTDSLVVYSGRKESLVGPLIEQFETETGIDVDVRWGSTGEIAALLMEEGENSPADVFFAQDPGGLGAVANQGLLTELPADIISLVPDNFVSNDNQWIGISGRARVIVYNTDAITDPATELPQDIWDFTDPKWKGKIGWPPTNGSFQAMVTAMRATWGEEKTKEWLMGIQANEPVIYEKNTPTVAGTAAGEVEVGFVNHYYLYRFLAEEGDGFAARNHFLTGGGPGSLIMVAGAGIMETSQNRANAEAFLEYMLSADGQQYFTDETFEYPVIDGIETVEGLPALSELTGNALDIDVSDYADLGATVEMMSELGILP